VNAWAVIRDTSVKPVGWQTTGEAIARSKDGDDTTATEEKARKEYRQ
jgi:hypothetical protein